MELAGWLIRRIGCLVLDHSPGKWTGIIFPVAYCTRCKKLLDG